MEKNNNLINEYPKMINFYLQQNKLVFKDINTYTRSIASCKMINKLQE